jgi:hypothetical protein
VIPSLKSVLLNDDATRDLERRFQTVFDDDDDPMVNGLNYGRHPERQRILFRPQLFSITGRATRAFVHTMQRMNNMNIKRLDAFRQNLHYSDCEYEAENDILVSDTESRPVIHEDMWADDDPASQTLSKPKAKAKGKTCPKLTTKPKPKTTPKAAAPRGRPRKDTAAMETPIRQAKTQSETPQTKTPNWRVSGLAQEGRSSSPPPTDPRFHVASQADTLGSDDTIGDDEVQDTQAYKLDSELASFIVEDEDDVDIPASSLQSLDLSGFGKGTQAVVQAARPKRAPRAEKIFTSDATDDDAIVSSDSDDDAPLVRSGAGSSKKLTFVVDSDSQDEDAPVAPRQRIRRIIEDDEDDDD